MAFRHFGNIAGGSVLTSLVYSALATVSGCRAGPCGPQPCGGIVILAIGAALLYSGVKGKKMPVKSLARSLP